MPLPALTDTRARKERLAALIAEKRLREERARQAESHGGLLAFVRYFWPVVEPARPLIEGWPLEAICEHLQAVSRGEIKRLCISVPPGFMKSLCANVFWCAHEWGPLGMPSTRYIAASYSQSLTLRDNVRFRNIIMSAEYRALWGHVFGPSKDQFNLTKVANDKTGWKLASSVGGVSTGERGDRFVIDDGNSVKESESQTITDSTNQWFTEVVPTRLNDAENGVIINIQQRTGELDITGKIIELGLPFERLVIPMEYESTRPPVPNAIGWIDPRALDDEGNVLDDSDRAERDGMLAWPARFSPKAVKDLKTTMGPYAVAGQFQQNPSPRGGGIIKQEWFQVWQEPTFPPCSYKWAAVDTAYTKDEANDPSGFSAWGLFEINGQPNIILLDAWSKRLELHIPAKWVDEGTVETRAQNVKRWKMAAWGEHRASVAVGETPPEPLIDFKVEPWASYIMSGQNSADRWPGETYSMWKLRTEPKWGLCEWLVHSCRRFKINDLLIEGKASGLSVAQELRRLNGNEGWGIHTRTPEGDKVARTYAVQATLSAGLVWAPDKGWAEDLIDQAIKFPRAAHDDMHDSMTMALKHIRDLGRLMRPEERQFEADMQAQYKPPSKPLYQV